MDITVLMHEKDPPLSFYWLGLMCDVWRSQGHTVREIHGVSRPIRGDIVFLHVDMTVVPDEYLQAIESHPRVANRRVTDISKTRLSRNRVRSPDDWDGPVIVKTVRNHGGAPERRIRRASVRGRMANLVSRLGRVSLARTDHLNPVHYPIFDSARDVPSGVYRNPALMVERFLPERSGDLFCYRTYDFLGNRSYCEIGRQCCPVGRFEITQERERIPVHDSIVTARGELGFDYGTIDYVVHEGRAELLDANRTPGGVRDPDSVRDEVRLLASGLESWMA